MEINIYLGHSPGKCYTFKYESQGKRYTSQGIIFLK